MCTTPAEKLVPSQGLWAELTAKLLTNFWSWDLQASDLGRHWLYFLACGTVLGVWERAGQLGSIVALGAAP